MINQKGKNGPL